MGYGGTILIPRSPHGDNSTVITEVVWNGTFERFRPNKWSTDDRNGYLYLFPLNRRHMKHIPCLRNVGHGYMTVTSNILL